jgi:peptidoglycan/xylan/chitin deacetylase (PgdA/CDA1 family)
MDARSTVKRYLKWSVELGMEYSGLGCLYRKTRYFQEGHRILAYHRIQRDPVNSYSVHTKDFADHIAFLADHHPVVSMATLCAGLAGDMSLQPHSVAITFDDGYVEYASTVADILNRSGLTATFFVVTGILDEHFPVAPDTFMRWQEVRSLSQAGFSIGSHCVTHVSLGTQTVDAVRVEVAESRERIRHELGTPPEGIAYPYGTLRDFSPQVAQLVKESGYQYGATAVNGLNHLGCDLFTLRRTSMTCGDGLKTFRLIMKGDLDPWLAVDRLAYRLQRPQSSMKDGSSQ